MRVTINCRSCGTTGYAARDEYGVAYGYCSRCGATTTFGDLSLDLARPFLKTDTDIGRWDWPAPLASRTAMLVKLGAPPPVLEQLRALWETWKVS